MAFDFYKSEREKTGPRPATNKHLAKNTTSKSQKEFLEICPVRCTQDRTNCYRLKEKKTFDIRANKCLNCGFTKLPKNAKMHGAGFKKASDLR